MKNIMLCALLFSFAIEAFDQAWYQQNICDDAIVQGKKPGFYRYNNAHHFKYEGEDYFVQRTNKDYFVKSKFGSVQLKGEIKRVLDFIIIDNHFWIVGETGLVEFNQQGRQVGQSTNYTKARGAYYHPYLDQVYLAAGVDGLAVFDFKSKKFETVYQLVPSGFSYPSSAVSVTGDLRGNIYLALTSYVQGTLNGIAVFSPAEEKITHYAQFDPVKAGYVDTYASIYYQNGSVYLNNSGWIHGVNKAELNNSSIVPRWHSLSHTAGDTFQYVQFRGDLIFEDDQVYGCSVIREKIPGEKRPLKYGKVFSLTI